MLLYIHVIVAIFQESVDVVFMYKTKYKKIYKIKKKKQKKRIIGYYQINEWGIQIDLNL